MNNRFNAHEQMSTILGYECAFDNQKNKWLSIEEVILYLNTLSNEIENLKKELDDVDDCLTRDDIRTLKVTRGFVV